MKIDQTDTPPMTSALQILPWRKWETTFGQPKTGVLKYLLLNRRDNGFNRCVITINGRTYLHVAETQKYFTDFCREVAR